MVHYIWLQTIVKRQQNIVFIELNLFLNQCVNKYDNIIVVGDHNIDISEKRWDNNNFLSDLYDTFSLQTVVIWKTCHKSNIGTSIDNSTIHRTGIFATRIRNHHQLIPPAFRSYYTRISPKTIEYKTCLLLRL